MLPQGLASARMPWGRGRILDKHKLRDIFRYWLTVEKSVGAGVAGGEAGGEVGCGLSKSYLRAAQNPDGPLPTGTEGNGVKSMSSKRRLLSACTAALWASGLLAASEAQANLLIDLRLPDGTKASNISAGQTLTFDIFAKVSSASAQSTAGFQELQGLFLSSPGSPTNLLGTLAPAGDKSGFPQVTVEGSAPFNARGSVPAASTHLDGDGDLDLGHSHSDDPTGFSYIRDAWANFESSHALPPPPATGPFTGNLVHAGAPLEWEIGEINFTAGASGKADGSKTNINFAYRKDSTGVIATSSALWFE